MVSHWPNAPRVDVRGDTHDLGDEDELDVGRERGVKSLWVDEDFGAYNYQSDPSWTPTSTARPLWTSSADLSPTSRLRLRFSLQPCRHSRRTASPCFDGHALPLEHSLDDNIWSEGWSTASSATFGTSAIPVGGGETSASFFVPPTPKERSIEGMTSPLDAHRTSRQKGVLTNSARSFPSGNHAGDEAFGGGGGTLDFTAHRPDLHDSRWPESEHLQDESQSRLEDDPETDWQWQWSRKPALVWDGEDDVNRSSDVYWGIAKAKTMPEL
jgi:hypothetical protein